MALADHRRTILAATLVAAAAASVYTSTLGHGFVLDDNAEVVRNEYIRSLSDLPRALTTRSWEGTGEGSPPQYRPLTTATYSLNYAVGGLAPFGYHLVNVALHVAASVLVLAIGLQLGLPLVPAALAGLAFAVHPVHVEAVANVAGRKDVLVTVLALAAVLVHGRALQRGRGPALAAAMVLFGGVLASKENGLTLIALLAMRDVLFGRGEWRDSPRRAIALYGAYALETGLFLWARWAAVGSLVFPTIGFEENPIASAPAGTRVLTAVAVLGKGLALLVAPLNLSADYSFDAIPAATSLGDPRVVASLFAAAALVALAVRLRRRSRIPAFALLWWALTILPASNLLVRIGTIFGERTLYLPSVASCIALGFAAAAVIRTRAEKLGWAAAILVLAAFSFQTVSYAAVWKDDPSLFAAAASSQPRSSRAHRMHGGAFMEQGRPAEAAQEFERALAILGEGSVPLGAFSRPRLELGVAYEALGRLGDAEALYRAMLRDDPANTDALERLAVVRWRQGRTAEAIALWRETIAVNPRDARAMSDLGIAYLVLGDAAAAKAIWLRAIQTDPTVAGVWYRLGNLYEREGDFAAARAAWAEFLRRAHEQYPQWRNEVAAKLGTSAAPR